jgi:hypothetical protein
VTPPEAVYKNNWKNRPRLSHRGEQSEAISLLCLLLSLSPPMIHLWASQYIFAFAAITTTLQEKNERWWRENNLKSSLLVLIYFFSFIMMYDNQCHSLKGEREFNSTHKTLRNECERRTEKCFLSRCVLSSLCCWSISEWC